MLFNSIDFALFFPIVFIVYWILSKHLKARNAFVLLSSYVFYGWWDWRFLFLIAFSSIVDFIVGQQLHKTEKKGKRKRILLISLFVNIGLLVYFKYTNFFIESFVESFRLFGAEIESTTLNIILPVGISFYTFQTLSYTIDIYRKQLEPTKDILAFFAFVSFFPQLVAGPIERASHLLPQFFKTHKFDYQMIKSGLLLMAWGLFKKMVIADRAAILANQVYNDLGLYQGYEVVIATLCFALQIYCDFSGYSDIAIGAGKTLGFDLMRNFDSPYFSTSITEFWRRWHISLSTWFRDYVYIPLGGSRLGEFKTYLNLFIVFLVSGLWHGAAITFVIWGAIHGVIIVLEKATSKLRKQVFERSNYLKTLIGLPVTFTIVCVSWVFFRANSFSDSVLVFKNAMLPSMSESIFNLGLNEREFKVLLVAIVVLIIKDLFDRRDSWIVKLHHQFFVLRWMSYILIALSIIYYGVYGSEEAAEFIYFQF